ncbi:MAG TPA: fumarylacetoacetate hydrolase family protein [Patescibacteria group bacterium]|nr:fumarylacetoacetate hydrolase family protein [Patescibacteria group bacterium]
MDNRNFTFTNGKTLPVGTMYCIGRNYALHAKEMGAAVPAEPIVFLKPPAAYVPDGGEIEIPVFSKNVHHELELVVVIGKDGENISKETAAEYIAGYAVGIDVTLRDVQAKAKEKGEPWAVAKGFKTSAPISNVIPADRFKNGIPHFDIDLFVNDERRQSGTTTDMERSISELIEYLSSVFTLRAGDCIFTGTPEGVAQVQPGDKIRAEIPWEVSLNISVSGL